MLMILNNSTVELCNEYKVSENVMYKRISRLKKRVRELINRICKGEFI